MKKFYAMLLMCAISLAAFSQESMPKPQRSNKGQQLEAEKVAFITRQLDLSVEEAQKFWPVYNKIESAQKSLQKAEKEAWKALNEGFKNKVGENELDVLLKNYLKAKESNINSHVKNAKEYYKVLSKEKTARFFVAQEKFRRTQVNKLRHGVVPGSAPRPASK